MDYIEKLERHLHGEKYWNIWNTEILEHQEAKNCKCKLSQQWMGKFTNGCNMKLVGEIFNLNLNEMKQQKI